MELYHTKETDISVKLCRRCWK